MLVPVDATNIARQATIIAGDGRRNFCFMVFSLSRKAAREGAAWKATATRSNLTPSKINVNVGFETGRNLGRPSVAVRRKSLPKEKAPVARGFRCPQRERERSRDLTPLDGFYDHFRRIRGRRSRRDAVQCGRVGHA